MKVELFDLPAVATVRMLSESDAETQLLDSIMKAMTGTQTLGIRINVDGQEGLTILAKHKTKPNGKKPKAPKAPTK